MIVSLLWSVGITAQKKTLYCFPGQGSDARIFDSLKIDSSYTVKIIEYGTPAEGQSLREFAIQLSGQMDTSGEFALLGVSLGGMICAELAEILNPKVVILISSAKNSRELPYGYRFQKTVPLHRLFPGSWILEGAKILQPIVEPDRNQNEATFKSMLAAKEPLYMERSVAMLVQWDRQTNSRKLYHIHGDRDNTLPIRRIKSPDYVVKGGSHMMTLTRADEISRIVNTLLLQ